MASYSIPLVYRNFFVCLAFLKKILDPDPALRLTVSDITEHRWYKQELTTSKYNVFIVCLLGVVM